MHARAILISCILGLVITVASALALAAWMPLSMYPRQTVYHFVAGGRPWSAAERSHLGVHNLWISELNAASMIPPAKPGSGPAPDLPTTPEAWVALARSQTAGRTDLALRNRPPRWGTFAFQGTAHPGVHTATDHSFGWPLPALWYHIQGVTNGNRASATAIEGGLLLTPRSSLEVRGYDFRALPLLPSWPGLLVNTACFALLWWIVFFAPRSIRKALRSRRGQCPTCGYDLRASPADAPCPECGRTVTPLQT